MNFYDNKVPLSMHDMQNQVSSARCFILFNIKKKKKKFLCRQQINSRNTSFPNFWNTSAEQKRNQIE